MRIMIGGGGSGGHIFPAVALAHSLQSRNRDIDIIFVGSNRNLDKSIFNKTERTFWLLSANRMPRGASLKWLSFLLFLFFDMLKGFLLVARIRPAAVIGFGGYVSLPLVAAAALFRIPTIIHEQNVVPGRANKLLASFADTIAVSFQETYDYLKRYKSKIVFTGNPVRTGIGGLDRDEAVKKLGLKKKRFTILVMGGSQGSHRLNDIVIQSMETIAQEYRDRLQVIHLSGTSDYEWLTRRYERIDVPNRVFSFIQDIDQAYGACDLAVTRSGASALFELAYLGKPMILIPYPYAMSHQRHNASVFSGKGAALCVEESRFTRRSFNEILGQLIDNDRVRNRLSGNARAMSVPGASARLADAIMRLTKGRRHGD